MTTKLFPGIPPRWRGCRRSRAVAFIGTALAAAALIHGCGRVEKEDPVARIRGIIPQLTAALNSRNIVDLRRLGTGNLQANSLIIETFAGAAEGSVRIGFQRLHMSGGKTELIVTVTRDDGAERTLSLFFKKQGKWRIDSFAYAAHGGREVGTAASDSL